MRIGIIGAGSIGGTLTRRFTALGHDVAVANSRGPASLEPLARQTGARASSVQEAVRSADVVILAVPLKAVAELPTDLFSGHVVVDANNYYPPRDGRIDELDGPRSASSPWVARHFRGARVVKAFNTIYFSHLEEHAAGNGSAGRRALPVAADDPAAKQQVMGLVDELGFDPLDAGSLAESWRQQPGTPVYNTRLDADQIRDGLARA
jgi:8-hydroxy-5-deazaflavin:NADPH oxidoreductase